MEELQLCLDHKREEVSRETSAGEGEPEPRSRNWPALPRKRIMKCKPFTNVQVNLAGDINVKAMCHSRATLKIYPVVFIGTLGQNTPPVCPNMS